MRYRAQDATIASLAVYSVAGADFPSDIAALQQAATGAASPRATSFSTTVSGLSEPAPARAGASC